MSDDELAAALQEIFDADDPSDGIDRKDGFGKHVVIESIVPVEDRGFPELAVAYRLWMPLRFRLRDIPRSGTTRVLAGEAWLLASGFETAEAYAPRVARAVSRSADNIYQDWRDRRRLGRIDRAEVERAVADEDELWARLVEHLAEYSEDVTVEDGVITVVERDGETVRVHVTPAEWRGFVVEHEIGARLDSGVDALSAGDGPGSALFALDEMIGSRTDAECHVVFFDGDFCRSVRAEVPPVGDPELNRRVDPIPGGYWYADPSDNSLHVFGPDHHD